MRRHTSAISIGPRTVSSASSVPLYEVYTQHPRGRRSAAPLRDVPALQRTDRQWPADLAPFAVALLASLFLLLAHPGPAGLEARPETAALAVGTRGCWCTRSRRRPTSGGGSPPISTTGSCRISPGPSFLLEAAAQDRRSLPSPGLHATLMKAATTTRGVDPRNCSRSYGDPPAQPALGGLGAALEDLLVLLHGPRDRTTISWTALSIESGHRVGRLPGCPARRSGKSASRDANNVTVRPRGDRGAGAPASRRRRCRLLRRPARPSDRRGACRVGPPESVAAGRGERWTWNPSRGRESSPVPRRDPCPDRRRPRRRPGRPDTAARRGLPTSSWSAWRPTAPRPSRSAARTAEPDVVLMDLDMPEIDGIEATRRLMDDGRTRS